jgi:transposase InsO family protein
MRRTAVPEQKLDTHSFRLGQVLRLGTCGTCWGVVHARLRWAKRERLLRGPPRSRFVLSGHEIGGAAGCWSPRQSRRRGRAAGGGGGPDKLRCTHRRRTWATRDQLRCALFDYVECFYNPVRIQERLGYRSPADSEQVSVA